MKTFKLLLNCTKFFSSLFILFLSCKKSDIYNHPSSSAKQSRVIQDVRKADDDYNDDVSGGYNKIYVQKNSGEDIYLKGEDLQYQPGDTIVLQNELQSFTLQDVHGQNGLPITIINEGLVTMTGTLTLNNCTYIRIYGNGDSSNFWGIDINNPSSNGIGINIAGFSGHITIKNVHIHSKNYGIWIENDPGCDKGYNYPSWSLNHITVKNCFIENITKDGMHLGSAQAAGITINCNGTPKLVIPTRLSYLTVHDNIIDNTHRTGIFISGADSGNNYVYNNQVTVSGGELNDSYGANIFLGRETQATVYDNTCANSWLQNIQSLGMGYIFIYSNFLNEAGSVSGNTHAGYSNILIDTRPTNPFKLTTFDIENNNVGANTDPNGVNVSVLKTHNFYTQTGNIISNSGIIYVAPGINYNN